MLYDKQLPHLAALACFASAVLHSLHNPFFYVVPAAACFFCFALRVITLSQRVGAATPLSARAFVFAGDDACAARVLQTCCASCFARDYAFGARLVWHKLFKVRCCLLCLRVRFRSAFGFDSDYPVSC